MDPAFPFPFRRGGAGGGSKVGRISPLSPDTSSMEEEEILQQYRQARYQQMREDAATNKQTPSIWSFEALFPEPVWDFEAIDKDLYAPSKQTNEILQRRKKRSFISSLRRSYYGEGRTTNLESLERQMRRQTALEPLASKFPPNVNTFINEGSDVPSVVIDEKSKNSGATIQNVEKQTNAEPVKGSNVKDVNKPVDREMSRLVKDRIYGTRTTSTGTYQYDNSLLDTSKAVQFTQEGRRIGRPLKVNLDRLNYAAKRAFRKNQLKEACELYEQAIELDPLDGRAYLGRAKCAQQVQDIATARKFLKKGVSRAIYENGTKNPYLLQALGVLEEKAGHLAQAEQLYLAAIRVSQTHAAAWVSLAQLRTDRLKQGVKAGRACYEAAERELKLAGEPPSSFVYTAWASLEYKQAGNAPLARELFMKAIEVDPKCSAAYLQLGVMESNLRRYDEAKECFEKVLKFDNRNSRVLQAYAIMESKRPGGQANSRHVIDLFERALKVNKRDAGVLQAYSIYVASLGDVETARELLKRATTVDKRHAPVWQAWGVMEMRHSSDAEIARDVFQQGIWACAQSSGGQSGGRYCARLWQAWGTLEAREGDHAAARRCFNRALDADARNVATITAWTKMELELGNENDARAIFERSLKTFASPSSDKMTIWRAYEQMERRFGNRKQAQLVYNRYMREILAAEAEYDSKTSSGLRVVTKPTATATSKDVSNRNLLNTEVEVVTWNKQRNNQRKNKRNGSWSFDDVEAEVWMHNGMIEGKMPQAELLKFNKQPPAKFKLIPSNHTVI